MIKTNSCILFALALAAASASGAAAPVVDAPAAFERLKALEGNWQSSQPGGQPAVTRFELVANGTVLMEHYSNPAMPGGGHMVSAYHLDGDMLVLTHYCIAKNQPTLRADRFDAATSEIQFEFLRATNLPDQNTGHMRRALYRLEGPNQFTTEWEFFRDGTKTMTERETFKRVK
jgi:hypothetical protein